MKKHWWKIGLALICGCLFLKYFEAILTFLGHLADVIAPLAFGAVLAYILNIVMRVLERGYEKKAKRNWVRKLKRPICMFLSFGFVLVILSAVIGLVVPEFVSSIRLLAKTIPQAVQNVIDFLLLRADDFPGLAEKLQGVKLDWSKLSGDVFGIATSGITSIFASAVNVAGSIFGGVFNTVIGLIFSIYLLANKERLAEQLKKLCRAYVPEKTRAVCGEFIGMLDESFSNFIVGQCTEAVILGGLCTIGMLILRLPYAVMTGVIVGVTALIPVVGAYIGAVAGALMIVMIDPMDALVFLIFLLILQQLEGNIIYPKVVGSSIGLPGMWVLAAVTLGGGLGGILGMLIGVPMAATFYKWLKRCTNLRLERDVVVEAVPEEQTKAEDVVQEE